MVRNWDKLFNVIYSLGASIVILGVLGKLTYSLWGDYLLYTGLIIEAVIFFISAFHYQAPPKSLIEEIQGVNFKNPYEKQAILNAKLDEPVASLDALEGFHSTKEAVSLVNELRSELQTSKKHDELADEMFNDLRQSSQSTREFRRQIQSLSNKLSVLNKVYSDMLLTMGACPSANPTNHDSENSRENDIPDVSTLYRYDGDEPRK